MIPLNAMTALWAVLLPLVDDVPDPEDVKPGWLGFAVFLLLAAALVVLAFSFRKQLRKVTFVEKDGDAAGPDERGEDRGDHNGDDDSGASRTP
jgi:hypothetical protein